MSRATVTTGTPLLSRARLKYRALRGVLQVFDFSFPSNIALKSGVGLPDCFLAAAGLAGHPAPGPGRDCWGTWLTQPPSNLRREATGEDGLTWPFVSRLGGALAWTVGNCLIPKRNGRIPPEHPFRSHCGKSNCKGLYGNNTLFIRWVNTYFKKGKISILSSRHITVETALVCQQQSCQNLVFESTDFIFWHLTRQLYYKGENDNRSQSSLPVLIPLLLEWEETSHCMLLYLLFRKTLDWTLITLSL